MPLGMQWGPNSDRTWAERSSGGEDPVLVVDEEQMKSGGVYLQGSQVHYVTRVPAPDLAE